MEEAPTPIKPEEDFKPEGPIEHLKKFEALYKENIKYEISIYKRGNYLIIETEISKDSQKSKYSNYYSLDDLQKSNKFLALCDNIDDIIDTICENTSKYSCNIIENNNFYQINIPVPVKNLKEISFILKERKKSQVEIINELISNSDIQKKEIEELNKNVKEQNIKIAKQDEIIKQQNNKINKLENEVTNLLEEIKKIKSENNTIKNDIKKKFEINPEVNSPSKIINTESFKQLNNWINPLRSLKFELIFTASINGDSAKVFHEICDGKGPTVTIVKGKNGYIFGGYVTVPFSSDDQFHYDDKAFLFSITNMKKFPIKIKEHAVRHSSLWGPYIGYTDNCDLAIGAGCLKNTLSYCSPKSYEFNRVDLIGTEERNFCVDNYEVYLVNQFILL